MTEMYHLNASWGGYLKLYVRLYYLIYNINYLDLDFS